MTAFELGILLTEKLNDTVVIPDGNFDVNKDPCEFLTSILLNSPSVPQHPSSVDDSVDAGANASVEDIGDFDGYFSGDDPDSSAPSAPLIEGFASDASPSTFSYIPETPTPSFNQPPLMSSTRLTHLRDDRLITPSPQGPAMVDYPRADTRYGSRQAFEPLVTSHKKVCFWCEREGTNHDAPPDEPELDLYGSREFHTQGTNNASAPESSRLGIQQIASVDANITSSNDLCPPSELPGLCGVNDLPPLLYRWSNTNSQGVNTETVLVAGWFTADYPDVGSPLQLSKSDFLNVFAAHVTRVQVPTPFISAFAHPLAPIHRALRNRENAKLSVIDPRKIPSPVFYAQPLAQITGTAVRRWKGYGEFAIWGYVPSEAIVCTFDIASFEDIVSGDLEIRKFLQLSLIQAQETCHRRLRRELRLNLQTCSYEENRPVLRRLAHSLGVPDEYQEYFATDVHEAWTMDLGPTYQDREELNDLRSPPAPAPRPAVSDMVDLLNEQSQRAVRYNSESTASYVPPKSDGGSCSDSTSEGGDDLSQSPEAPCPRRNTPSPAFSVASDSEDSVQVTMDRSRGRVVEMTAIAVPPTPSSTSRYFSRSANVNVNASPTIPPLNLSRLNLSSSLNDDNYLSEGAQWPSDGDTLPGTDTPTQSRYFDRHQH